MRDEASPLIAFYSGHGADHRGRTLSGILGSSDEWLEREHDYIQWLFPIGERSPYNPEAPIVDSEAIDAFARQSDLRSNQQLAFQRMMLFYGFEVDYDIDDDGTITVYVDRSKNFERQAQRWLRPTNHNYKRITRILKSTSLLSSPHLARGLGEALVLLGRDSGGRIGSQTLAIWKSASFGHAR